MENKSIKVNFIFNAVKTVMLVLFPIISFPYVSRVLGVEGIGAVQYCTSVISYFALFASLGIGGYAVREGVKYKADKAKLTKFFREIFTINLCSTTLVYLALILCLRMNLFRGDETLILVCSLTILFNTLAVDWMYQVMEEYVYISIRTITLQFIALVCMFLFIKSEEDKVVYALITVLASGGYCFFNLFHARKYLDFSSREKLEFRKHFSRIFIIFGTSLAVSIYMNMDIVMLRLIHGEYEVGLYTAAVKIALIVKNIITSVSVVILPRAALYVARGEKEQYRQLLNRGANLNLMLSMPAACGLALLSDSVIFLFSGPAFMSAALTSKVLSVNIIFSAIDNIFYNQVLIPNNREKLACLGTVIGAVMNLALNALLIPHFKIMGAAVATFLSELWVFLFFLKHIRDIVSLRDIFSKVYQYLIAAVPIVLVVTLSNLLMDNYIARLAVCIPAGALLYFVVLHLLKNDLIEEGLQYAKRLVKRGRRVKHE